MKNKTNVLLDSKKYAFFTVIAFKRQKKDSSAEDVGDEDRTNTDGAKDDGSTSTEAFASTANFFGIFHVF